MQGAPSESDRSEALEALLQLEASSPPSKGYTLRPMGVGVPGVAKVLRLSSPGGGIEDSAGSHQEGVVNSMLSTQHSDCCCCAVTVGRRISFVEQDRETAESFVEAALLARGSSRAGLDRTTDLRPIPTPLRRCTRWPVVGSLRCA